MQPKVYKSSRQQLQILRNRGMIINKGAQGSRVMKILESENYYNVINGYKEPFLASKATTTADEVYKPGTTFDEIYTLYTFDREIRNIYLKYLLKAENQFKTIISHEFSRLYGHDNYLKISNFQCGPSTNPGHLKQIAARNKLQYPNDLNKINQLSTEENIASITKLFGDIQQEIARQMNKHHDVVTHYMTTHGYIPLWVLVNVLTFGKITAFYFNMKDADKTTIAKQFGLMPDELHKYMDNLGLARNLCAHDERFFDVHFKKGIHTKSIKQFNVLGIPNTNGNYAYGLSDAYSIAIMLSLILKKSDINEFISSMKGAFTKLSKQLHTISIDSIMARMGYGPNWTNLSKLCK